MENKSPISNNTQITDKLFIGCKEDENGTISELTIFGSVNNNNDLKKVIDKLIDIEKNHVLLNDLNTSSKDCTTVYDALFGENVKDEPFMMNVNNMMDKFKRTSSLRDNDKYCNKQGCKETTNTLRDVCVLDEIKNLKEKIERLSEYVMGKEPTAQKQDERILSKQQELREAQDRTEKAKRELFELMKKKEIDNNPSTFVLMELEKQDAYRKCCEKDDEGTIKLNKDKFHEMISEAIKKVYGENC